MYLARAFLSSITSKSFKKQVVIDYMWKSMKMKLYQRVFSLGVRLRLDKINKSIGKFGIKLKFATQTTKYTFFPINKAISIQRNSARVCVCMCRICVWFVFEFAWVCVSLFVYNCWCWYNVCVCVRVVQAFL